MEKKLCLYCLHNLRFVHEDREGVNVQCIQHGPVHTLFILKCGNCHIEGGNCTVLTAHERVRESVAHPTAHFSPGHLR